MTDKPTAAKEPPWAAILRKRDAERVVLLRQFEQSLAKVKKKD